MSITKDVLRKHARRVYGSQWFKPLAQDARMSQAELQDIYDRDLPIPNYVVEALVDALRAQAGRLTASVRDLEPFRRSGRQ